MALNTTRQGWVSSDHSREHLRAWRAAWAILPFAYLLLGLAEEWFHGAAARMSTHWTYTLTAVAVLAMAWVQHWTGGYWKVHLRVDDLDDLALAARARRIREVHMFALIGLALAVFAVGVSSQPLIVAPLCVALATACREICWACSFAPGVSR